MAMGTLIASQEFQQIVMQGRTFFQASGDDGT
jgi:hypothetical protein